ncbi:hypothetical protein Emtol_3894 [Emticicia oligotrophica DSM 17448]|uniref:YdhG-like domain-containing protein n=1 Tax=Emticicia oligotrophica (strain DSM 17448 / CIP 109782 / MTCC 6937 / GPTSA100-15) TaxID=929562 RepID=A0ABM5N649_EMTOG|nr:MULTISPECIES: DUF1801 domain-containing protein [Emticicia]AFK05020.1 hypothetical protein Emtol_3894 [Emticicia oligotrophica DSM 17448]
MERYISIEDFIESQNTDIGLLLTQLRNCVLNTHPKMKERFLYNTAMFGVKNELCYFNVLKNDKGIEVGFHRGFQLSNEQNILENKNRKFIHGITFKNISDFKEKEALFIEVIQEAIILDDIHEKSIFSEMLQNGRKAKQKINPSKD